MLDIFMITKKRSSDYKVKIKMQNKCDNCGNQIREDEEVYKFDARKPRILVAEVIDRNNI